MKKRMASMLLVTLLVGLLTPATNVQAETPSRESLLDKCGLEQITVIELPEDILEQPPIVMSTGGDTNVTAEERAYWTQYSSEYFYNFLNAEEKAFWDALEESCLAVAATTRDYVAYCDYAPCSTSISEDRMLELVFLFIYSNPQYYFLEPYVTYYYGYNQRAAIRIYDEFGNGDTRQNYTGEFTAKVDQWVNQVAAQSRPEEKVKLAHDIVCENTVYNFNLYDQSAYSMVCLGETVCSGYAKTMEMLLNAAGVETIMVTSSSHGWNAVRIHDIWYEVDATWDDGDYGIYYDFYNKSRLTYYTYDQSRSHVEEDVYAPMLVNAPYDMAEGCCYISPYFTVGGNTYFTVNSNAELGERMVLRVEGSAALPGTVTYNNIEYKVIGGAITETEEPTLIPDNEQVKAFVERMYTIVLGRDAVETEVNEWTNALLAWRVDGVKLADGFVNGDEFKRKNLDDSAYLDILYRAFMNREADVAGKQGWLNGLAGGMTREDVLASFISSAEFASLCERYGIYAVFSQEDLVENFVERMYSVVLNREATPSEVNGWTGPLLNWTIDGAELAGGFINSNEFKGRNLNNSDYVDVLYRAIMNREADVQGKNGWMNALNGGMAREAVLNSFVTASEFETLCEEYGILAVITKEDLVRGFVERMYTVVLNREANEEEVENWAAGLLNQTVYGANVAEGFIQSAEFAERYLDDMEYIDVLYQALFKRVPGTSEKEAWIRGLRKGKTRRMVMVDFLNSVEFEMLCEDYGILCGKVQ